MNDGAKAGIPADSAPTGMPPTNAPALDPQLVEIWKKYEDIAMHFNDLIMRWRLQAMGSCGSW